MACFSVSDSPIPYQQDEDHKNSAYCVWLLRGLNDFIQSTKSCLIITNISFLKIYITEKKTKTKQNKKNIHNCFIYLYSNVFIFIYLFLAALGLCCCTWAFSSCGKWGLLFVAVSRHCDAFSCCGVRALGARASVVVARGLSICGSRALVRRLSSCGAWAQLLCGTWALPGPGLKPVSPALAGGLLTTAPPGKSQ